MKYNTMLTLSTRPFLAILLIFLVSGPLLGQRKPRIKGSRNPITINESLQPFTAIEIQDDLEIRLVGGRQEGYGLEVDDNLVDVLRFEVRDSTLYISSFYRITASKKLEITVFFRELSSLNAQAGRVFNDDLINADGIDLSAGEAAKLNMRIRASLCTLNLEGNASADMNIEADSLSIHMQERAGATIYAVNEALQLRLIGNGSLTLEGVASRLGAEVLDFGNLKASRMEADQLSLSADNSAKSEVRAVTTCTLDLAGLSRTHIYGNPTVQLSHFADRSTLLKEED